MFLEASNGNNLEQPIVHENAAHFVPPPISMELPNIVTTGIPPGLPPGIPPGIPSGIPAPPLPGPSSNAVKVPPPLPGN